MFSKSYSNKSENEYISACTILFENIENELILYPSKIGIKDFKDMTKTNIFSDRYEKDKTRNTLKFFNGVLGAISDEIYDGNRKDYKSFVESSFKNTFPLGGFLLKSFFIDNKSSDQFFQQGRKWGKEFYKRYENNNLAEAQKPTKQKPKKTTKFLSPREIKQMQNRQAVLDHIAYNALPNEEKEKREKEEKERAARAEKDRIRRQEIREREEEKERPLEIRVALWVVVPFMIIIILLTLVEQTVN